MCKEMKMSHKCPDDSDMFNCNDTGSNCIPDRWYVCTYIVLYNECFARFSVDTGMKLKKKNIQSLSVRPEVPKLSFIVNC